MVKRYIWHSPSGQLLAEDECMIVELTDEEARLVREGDEEPSEKLARVIRK